MNAAVEGREIGGWWFEQADRELHGLALPPSSSGYTRLTITW